MRVCWIGHLFTDYPLKSQSLLPDNFFICPSWKILEFKQTETKKADTVGAPTKEENPSKEYIGFADKFFKKEMPLSCPGEILSIFRVDKEEFHAIENSDLKFLKDNYKSPSPFFKIERTAIYNIASSKEFSILLYHVGQSDGSMVVKSKQTT